MAFGSLLVMIVYGLVWEQLYQALQQLRWDKDWPSIFALLSVLVEAPLVWLLDFLFPIMSMSGSGMQMSGPMGPMSSSPGLPSPYFPAFAIHIGTTWAAMWLFSQGPMRVICVRWRFEGARVLGAVLPESPPADGQPQIPWREGNGTAGVRLADAVPSLKDAAAGDLVQGITCGRGHFGYPGRRYCMICGVSLPPLTGTLGPGLRPPLGVLIFDDGARYVVDHDLRLAQVGESGTLTVGHRDEIPAPALAEIRLAGWQPVVSSELYSIEVALPGGGRLHVAPGAVLAEMRPGTEFTIGKHRIRYESPYHPADWDASRSAFRPASSIRSEAPSAAATVISNISSSL
jgi:hypothetical protein